MNSLLQHTYSYNFRIPVILSAIVVTVWISGCTSSKSTRESAIGGQNAEIHKPSQTPMQSQQLAMYRNKLSDLYATQHNTIPAVFTNNQVTETGYNQNYGYRIQIIATSHKDSAEAVLHRFNNWIFQQPKIEYKAHAYIIFKQPDYRVQVGDFVTQENATRFARILKRMKYPDAWIVRDNVNPAYVPADSTIDNSMQ